MLRIEGKNISFSREDIEIFSEINFSVRSGQLLWIKGDNGTGKTTLLRIISGILQNFSGNIFFYREEIVSNTKSKDVQEWVTSNVFSTKKSKTAFNTACEFESNCSDKEKNTASGIPDSTNYFQEINTLPQDGSFTRLINETSRKDKTSSEAKSVLKTSMKEIQALGEITYIGEKSGYDENFSVFENLHFWAKLRNCTELLPATLNFFNLNKVADIEIKKLSSGWKKRISLSKLLLFNSKIWILDEPLIHLDRDTIGLFTQLFDLRLRQGGIIFLVHHGKLQLDQRRIIEMFLR